MKTLKKALPFLGIAIAIALIYDGWIFYSRWSAARADERAVTYTEPRTGRVGSPAALRKGTAANICYGVTGAARLRLEPPVEEVWPALNHCLQVKPSRDTEYRLTAEDSAGHSVSESFTLRVYP